MGWTLPGGARGTGKPNAAAGPSSISMDYILHVGSKTLNLTHESAIELRDALNRLLRA